MIVALDVGNSNVVFGLAEAGRVGFTGRAATPTPDRAYELEAMIDEALGHGPVGTPFGYELVAASVVPALTVALHGLARRRGVPLLMADETTVPLPIRTDQPAHAGADRLVNALAATRLFGAPAIVVDLGTATTFDVVDHEGAFVGGAIAPGVGLGLDSLAAGTAQLPRVELTLPEHAIGRTTVAAIQSGTVLGHVGLVTHLLRAMTAELAAINGHRPTVILTGGLSAHPWVSAIPGVDAVEPLLTLRGLAILADEAAPAASVPSA